MDTSVLSSTFFLTLLLCVGLFFFIRGSIKDRTQSIRLVLESAGDRSDVSVLQPLQEYFMQRAYRVAAVDAVPGQMTLEGIVQPSLPLAIFLTALAAIGVGCLALVLSILLPQGGWLWFGLVVLSPGAGVFYWRGAQRSEQVLLRLDTSPENEIENNVPVTSSSEARTDTPSFDAQASPTKQVVTVIAHRDELIALQQAGRFQLAE